jgi:hypothetical protein
MDRCINVLHASGDLGYWQQTVVDKNVLSADRLTALCVVGMSSIGDSYHFLLPFLKSTNIKERWISARFLGFMKEEQALPVLVAMLTENIPIQNNQESDAWFDLWRLYAPKLLRYWQAPLVLAALKNALEVWVRNESLFDENEDIWQIYEEELSYELGYREHLDIVNTLKISPQHRAVIMVDLAKGYIAKEKARGLLDECLQRKQTRNNLRSVRQNIIDVLTSKYSITSEEAESNFEIYIKRH